MDWLLRTWRLEQPIRLFAGIDGTLDSASLFFPGILHHQVQKYTQAYRD